MSLDRDEQVEGHPFDAIFNAVNRVPIHWQVTLSVPPEELREAGLEPACPTDPCTISLELAPVASGAQLRVLQFQMGNVDVAQDTSRDVGQTGFAQALRAFIAGTYFGESDRTVKPFALLDPYRRKAEENGPGGLVPQWVRDDLFDARQSLDRERRSRWSLFVQLMRELEPELGPGRFDTAFDRATGRANLVYDASETALSIDRLGEGVQRMVALLGSLVLVRAHLVGFAEPELGLAPTLQQRFLRAVDRLLAVPGGPQQIFFTTHSPIMGAHDSAFALELRDGVPLVECRPWEGAGPLPPLPDLAPSRMGGQASPADLDGLIGLVDQLAEMEPDQRVAAAPAGAAKAGGSAPRAGQAGAAPSNGAPSWKWQPKK